MRFTVSILIALALWVRVEADVRFTSPRPFPDLGLKMPILADATADIPSLPRTSSFLVTDGKGAQRLEDRFDTYDLWMAETVRARWRDSRGHTLTVARLTAQPPDDAPGTLSTRTAFAKACASRVLAPKDAASRDTAVVACAPVDVGEQPVRPRRSQRRMLDRLFYYPSTNAQASVWVFRPASPARGAETDWYMAAFVAAPGSDAAAAHAAFDEAFLDGVSSLDAEALRRERRERAQTRTEEEEGVRAYCRSVVNYASWHATAAPGVVVVDDLPREWHGPFVSTLTNDLPRMRRAYAAAAPSPLAGDTPFAAVRVFFDKRDYVAYVGDAAAWTAALWSPQHRELVLHLPPGGTDDLLKTMRHEAFHQYLAYAGAMATAAPWFNEGHAELFAHSAFDDAGELVAEENREAASWIRAHAKELAPTLPAFLMADYDAFYAGTQDERRARYYLAWSIVYFIEKGAPKVRFAPFEHLRADYMKELVRLRDGYAATVSVLPTDKLDLFVAEWMAFWTK